ncbi:PP2C family serine/threonine-protein phosphatase [Marinobacterium sedimentorum]|uniref:PP2C family serine/threonine-protein phosphatase n=1 Tax=Marinobacterium sedimentorum TaxID=2927804 RepID=UPI0020C5F8AA|nr:PP2C family serine/threonine-protein phosphatase [Marinobacterium sedimentorum]MCP8687136.1 protein phosphatase 2C domain-containing protein [Marinobacterium sedimentorum]
MQFFAAGSSVRGPAHVEQGLPNQDSILLRGHRGGWMAAACDGLGSCEFSHVGSAAACDSLRQVLSRGCIDSTASVSAALHQEWFQKIRPYAVRDVATTCLWASVAADGLCRLGQIGDGLVLYRSAGRLFQLTPNRLGFGNQTLALWDEYKEQHWHHVDIVLSQPGDGILLMTDGVSEDIVPDMLQDFFSAVYRSVAQRGRRAGRQWLNNELQNWSTPMHGDDKSIVAIFRSD